MHPALKSFWRVINEDLAHLKNDLRSSHGFKEKAPIYAGIAAKALVTLIFCVLFVIGFVTVLGPDNAIVGVVVLLSVLTFQKVHFGYSSGQGALALFFIFILFAAVPPAAQYLTGLGGWPALGGFALLAATLMLILILGCDRVEFQNHIVLVLSFLLLYGYPAPRAAQPARIAGLLLGGAWAASILYRKNQHNTSTRGLGAVFSDFDPRTKADEWKLKLAILVPLAMWCGTLVGLERVMWIGIAAMSVLSPYEHLRLGKMFERILGTILGSILFYGLTLIPGMTPTLVGLSGGFLVGLTTSYRYQTIFNSLGALSVAMLLMGPTSSITARILDNAFGIIFVLIVVFIIDQVADYLQRTFGNKNKPAEDA
ncbi:hypothetical protein BSR29_05260 [Boudabousia liubingyangii]|uniref:Integral membrane bound transporter domain-containing protein n=1 Tax=Boudabousia liubingyangii TaxID=1921764 RepID=A0A1Q5PLK3_9ACTO|nr:FUSC family protein [Boudabousia liubingyangii]OKL47042.1 hypothetical protein BSR28_06420 [Boudabousia liubingyangii]OKL47897.1 hypothetical protein BSR29_05260 [Boudabousia liubingyangii]